MINKIICAILLLIVFLHSHANDLPLSDWDPSSKIDGPKHEDVAKRIDLLPTFIAFGEDLFNKKFTQHDGAGRPGATGDSKPTARSISNNINFIRTSGPDAMSCVACHNHPKVGGSGDFVANVFVGAHLSDPPSNSIEFEATSERNTLTTFGSGLIELLAREITHELRAQRKMALDQAIRLGSEVEIILTSKGIQFGSIVTKPDGTINLANIQGIDYDLVIRPFGVKGIAASLREFSIGALNQHHGIQAVERFGWERTGRRDFDLDGIEDEFTIGQLSALVLFQATLPAPIQTFSNVPAEKEKEQKGKAIFEGIGCAGCHIPWLPLNNNTFSEPNQFNRPGAITPKDIGKTIDIKLDTGIDDKLLVRAYTDFKRHVICDDVTTHFCNERLKQDNVETNEFLTAKLWDLNTSAPYGHRGDLTTVSAAILAHGGEANASREDFMRLDEDEKKSVISFLFTLGRE